MRCLTVVLSYIPLLLLPLPLSLSPIHLTLLLTLTYILNRPCIYCSLLLLILFASSCYWSNRCFVDFSYTSIEDGGLGTLTWWIPRLYTTSGTNAATAPLDRTAVDTEFWAEVLNSTAVGLANAVFQNVKHRLTGTDGSTPTSNIGSGFGSGWIKNLLGKSEWTLPCTQWKIAV